MELKGFIYKYSIPIFFALTIFISWGAILIIFGTGGIPATAEIRELVGMAILLGPSTAGLLSIWITQKSPGFTKLISRLFRWQVNFRWYILALIIAPLTTLISVFIFSFLSENYHPAILTAENPRNLVLLGLIGGLIVGLFEELGWTGFATPRLRKHFNMLATGMIIGIIWGAWHFILFWEEDSFSKNLAFYLLVARLFAWLPAFRILMVWMVQKTNSLLLIILMHTSLVLSLAILDPVFANEDLLIYILIRALILWIIVAYLFISGNLQIKSID